jgi:hypothetical protein
VLGPDCVIDFKEEVDTDTILQYKRLVSLSASNIYFSIAQELYEGKIPDFVGTF